MTRWRTAYSRGAPVRHALNRIGWLVCLLTSAGCQGTVDGGMGLPNGVNGPARQDDDRGSGSPGDGFLGDAPPGEGSGPNVSRSCIPGRPQPTTRIVRLTHTEYDETVRDLLGLDVRPSLDFLADSVAGGFDNNADSLVVGDRLGRDYRRAAESLAERLSEETEALWRLVPCDPAADVEACAHAFVVTFGKRAFRRPLSTDEVERYVALHEAGASYFGQPAFASGVRLVVEAMLQSPKFLYRSELSNDVDRDGLIPLNDFEIASRLSYSLWGTMPDDALFEAAESGGLQSPAAVASEARRMLESPKAANVIADFHRQWLKLFKYNDLTRDSELFPAFSPSLGSAMVEEVQRYVRHVVLDLDEGFETMLTAPFTFVNRGLAGLYGLQGNFGDDFERVDLDPALRGGLLTQLGFLAANAYVQQTSPIHRGVFVHRQLLCTNIPEPPGDVDLNLPPLDDTLRTTRDVVTAHTSGDACVGCHGMINPAGFPFEHYDAVGQYRDFDNGVPVNASAELTIDGETVAIDDAVGLGQALAQSNQARACYATQWLRYAYQRRDSTEDACTIEVLATRLGQPGYSIKDMLVDLTQTRAFFQRAPEE